MSRARAVAQTHRAAHLVAMWHQRKVVMVII